MNARKFLTALLIVASLLTAPVAFAADNLQRQNPVSEQNIALSNREVDEAKKFFDSGNYNDAIKAASNAIELNPNNANAYFRRGGAYFNLKQYDQAVRDYNKAIALNPKNNLAYRNRGWLYCKLGYVHTIELRKINE